jgi:hypothetical protein
MAGEVTNVLGTTATALSARDGSVVRRVLAREADVQWWGGMLRDLCMLRPERTDAASGEPREPATILRLATGLEHVAELAVRVAARVRDLHETGPVPATPELLQAMEAAQAAVRLAMDVAADPVGRGPEALAGLPRGLWSAPPRAAEASAAGTPDARQIRRAAWLRELAGDVERLLEAALDLPLLAAESAAPAAARCAEDPEGRSAGAMARADGVRHGGDDPSGSAAPHGRGGRPAARPATGVVGAPGLSPARD